MSHATQHPTGPRGSPPPAGSDLSTSGAIATGSPEFRSFADIGADRYTLLDWLTPPQPDGTTDNRATIQSALAAAAGKAALVIPAQTSPYVVNWNVASPHQLTLSPNTHLIIESGATLLLGGAILLANNSHITVESGAVLKMQDNANASAIALPAGHTANALIDLYGTLDGNGSKQTAGGGLVSQGGSSCSNIYMRGHRQGQILNFKSWPVNLASCVNGEIAEVTIDGGGSVVFVGTSSTPITSFTGAYTYTSGPNGLLTITTSAPHGLAIGQSFTLTQATGTGSYTSLDAQYTVIAGTTGPATSTTVINCLAPPNLGALTLTGGNIQTQMQSVGGATTGTYTNPGAALNCTVTLTTTTAHNIVPGQHFWLVNPPVSAVCPPATGLATGTGDFAKLIGMQYTAIAGTTGTTLVALALAGLNPTTITAVGVCTSTANYNVGMRDCVVRNIHDLGVVLYGGNNSGYIRGCDISTCQGGGAMVYTDNAQPAPNIDCDISDNVIWNNPGSGLYIGTNLLGQSNIAGAYHKNIQITDNHIFGNKFCGMIIAYVDGVHISDNYLHDNIYTVATLGTLGIAGEISITNTSSHVSVMDNTIRNPMVGNVGTVAFGIAHDTSNNLRISDNQISDDKTQKSMYACIGGTWGTQGLSEGNYYGARMTGTISAPSADMSAYNFTSIQGASFDLTAPSTALQVDSNGNTQIGGALCHNGWAGGTLADGGTITIPPNIDFYMVNNAASISAGTIILPTAGSSMQNNANLEILFIARVGTLTILPPTGYTVQNPPTSVPVASNSYNFILNNVGWRRRIMA